MKSIAVRLVACVFILFGGLFLYGGVNNLLIGNASKNWPTVPGKVISSTVESRQWRKSSSKHRDREVKVYYAGVRYEYTVNGKTRSSNDIAYGGYSVNESPSEAKAIVDKYPVGSPVTVYYSPSRPATAVLEPGVRDSPYVLSLFGAFCFGMGVIAFVQLPKSIQRQRVTRESSVPTVSIQ